MAFIKIGIPENFGVVTTTGTVPVAETLTGTISHNNSTKVVTGTGTKFTTELQPGQYIYANNTVVKVLQVRDDLFLTVDKLFGAVLSSVTLKMCRSGVYRYIKLENTHASAVCTVMNASVPAGKAVEYREEGGLAPVVYDGTSSSILISAVQ